MGDVRIPPHCRRLSHMPRPAAVGRLRPVTLTQSGHSRDSSTLRRAKGSLASVEELADIATMTRELSRQVELTQVIFNNNYEDQGRGNGREMAALLAGNP